MGWRWVKQHNFKDPQKTKPLVTLQLATFFSKVVFQWAILMHQALYSALQRLSISCYTILWLMEFRQPDVTVIDLVMQLPNRTINSFSQLHSCIFIQPGFPQEMDIVPNTASIMTKPTQSVFVDMEDILVLHLPDIQRLIGGMIEHLKILGQPQLLLFVLCPPWFPIEEWIKQ